MGYGADVAEFAADHGITDFDLACEMYNDPGIDFDFDDFPADDDDDDIDDDGGVGDEAGSEPDGDSPGSGHPVPSHHVPLPRVQGACPHPEQCRIRSVWRQAEWRRLWQCRDSAICVAKP